MSSQLGLLIPFRRDRKRDFASGTGTDLLRSRVTQVLATEGATAGSAGELPWRTSFGSAIHLLRHQANDHALAELARVYARDALRRWVPGAEVANVEVERDGTALTLRLRVVQRELVDGVLGDLLPPAAQEGGVEGLSVGGEGQAAVVPALGENRAQGLPVRGAAVGGVEGHHLYAARLVVT